MILKTKDGREADVQELKRLLTLKLSVKQRSAIDNELKFLVSGEKNENNSAYYLDFKYKDSKNWMIVHDLRLAHRGRVAQIDHLLINRFLNVYVLESKNYYYGVKITEEGEFLRWDGKSYQAIESPYEQNRRHIQVLGDCIKDRKLAPVRLGIPIPVNYKNIILVSPTSNLVKPKRAPFELSSVVKADAFISYIEKETDSISTVSAITSAAKLIGTDTLLDFGEKIVRLHKPGSIDYAAKFGVTELAVPVKATEFIHGSPAPNSPVSAVCQECGAEVDKKVVFYCKINKTKFNGQLLCRECQRIPDIEIV